MTSPLFVRATKRQAKLRMGMAGPSGSGKTFTSIQLATLLAGPDGQVAVIDTERGSAAKYADLFGFDVLELTSFHPERYIEAIQAAGQAGYAALVVDSLSHAWSGKDGALELKDRAEKRSQSGNGWTAWREVTPLHNALVDAMLAAPLHVLVTMRSKQEYVQEKDERGRTVIRKVGLAPIQRDGLEYEFDVYGEMTQENDLVISKSRCPALTGQVLRRPGKEIADTLRAWLDSGEAALPAVVVAAATPVATPEAHRNGNGAAAPTDPNSLDAVIAEAEGRAAEAVSKPARTKRQRPDGLSAEVEARLIAVGKDAGDRLGAGMQADVKAKAVAAGLPGASQVQTDAQAEAWISILTEALNSDHAALPF